jgi:hypothetical protein
MAHKKRRQAGETPEIEITKEMIDAGLRVAWSAPNPPKFAVEQVRRIYEAMERARRAKA